MRSRVATAGDVNLVADVVTEAFAGDPAWTWVFDDPTTYATQSRPLWTLFVEGALPHGAVRISEGAEAVSVWLPPGREELDAEQTVELERYLDTLPADVGSRARSLMDRFEAAHPGVEPMHYLSLLATHPDHRGHGHGMRLLADDLARIDARGTPSYLESTNPANLARYGAQGFVVNDTFDLPGGPTVTTMLRPAR